MVAAAKVTTALERLSTGNFSSVKSAGEGVLEYRIDFGPGYRIYFGKDGEELVILVAVEVRSDSRKILRRPGQIGKITSFESKQVNKMALTKDFRSTIRDRAQGDPGFRQALLGEAVELMLAGDLEIGKTLVRNYINATIGFQELSRAVDTPAQSLMRMLGPKGNPSAKNLFSVIAQLQKHEAFSSS